MRPNIVWIVLDTARADALEPYGAAAGSTPAVAQLAGRGEALAHVRTTACWTLPAHLSMFAGGFPRALGLADQAGVNPHNARPIVEAVGDRLIPEVLRRSGYRTACVSTNAWISRHSGFATGFERFEESVTTRQGRMSSPAPRARLQWWLEAAHARADDGARDAERVMREWISDMPSEPFFWFVNLVECHSPYLPPKPYAELSAPQRVRAAREASRYLTQAAFWRACVTGDMPSPDALERMRSGYRGAIRYMDDWTGRLLESLDSAGVLDDTLVIVTSDHGENFGENDLLAHGFSLDERLIHVPFVAAGPGAEHLRGMRSFAELAGRLAEIAGASDHPYDPAGLPALAVAQFDPPVNGVHDPRTAKLVSDWKLDQAAVALLTTPFTAAVDGTLKLVAHPASEAFYDLVADPLELRPLGAAEVDAQSVARLRAALAHPSVVASEARLNQAVPPPPSVPDAEVADLEDRMRLLGYL